MLDKFKRKINYLRLSVTDFCDLRCKYCISKDDIKRLSHDDILRFEEIETIVKELAALGIKKIRLTGGEPLLKRNITDLIKKIRNVTGINEVSITTNGIHLKEYARALKELGIHSINISLDTLDSDTYSFITGENNLKEVLQGIDETKKIGFNSIKLNVVLLKGINEQDINKFINLTKYERIDVRFIELMPIGAQNKWAEDHYLPSSFVLNKRTDLIKIKQNDISAPSSYYKLENAKGRIGLIEPISKNFCMYCNRIRLSADGMLKSCLHSDNSLDLKSVVRKKENIKQAIQEFVFNKPKSHALDKRIYSKESMYQIGG